MKPLIIGESNPYGGDPSFALYPAPERSAGYRLCCLILGMRRVEYLEMFDRCNLVEGTWMGREARKKASKLAVEFRADNRRVILLGSKVSKAFDVPYDPFKLVTQTSLFGYVTYLVLPHPSGMCRAWNEPGAFERARTVASAYIPELAQYYLEVSIDAATAD